MASIRVVSALLCIVFLQWACIDAHPVTWFSLALTDSSGNEFFDTPAVNTTTTIYFKLKDLRNALAVVKGNQIVSAHQRYIHIQVASADTEWVWHLHPDDFGDINTMISSGLFHFDIEFPRGGLYEMAITFLFRASTGAISDSHAFTTFTVTGLPAQKKRDSVAWDYSISKKFVGYPIAADNIHNDPVYSEENLDPNGYRVDYYFDTSYASKPMSMKRDAPANGKNDNVPYNKCIPYFINVYNKDGSPATKMKPYLAAAVHLTGAASDSALYHGHGMALPSDKTFDEIVEMSKTMDHGTMTDLMMETMMIGIHGGRFNCTYDMGEMASMMDMNHFYGPTYFGPTLAGLFSFDALGAWRMYNYMIVETVNGTMDLIVAHFDVNVTFVEEFTPTSSTTSTDDTQQQTNGSPLLLADYRSIWMVLLAIIAIAISTRR